MSEIKDDCTHIITSSHIDSELKYDRIYILNILPPRQKFALQKTMEGYSQKEIAKTMATSVGAVKNLVMRGRAKIKQFMESEVNSIA